MGFQDKDTFKDFIIAPILLNVSLTPFEEERDVQTVKVQNHGWSRSAGDKTRTHSRIPSQQPFY